MLVPPLVADHLGYSRLVRSPTRDLDRLPVWLLFFSCLRCVLRCSIMLGLDSVSSRFGVRPWYIPRLRLVLTCCGVSALRLAFESRGPVKSPCWRLFPVGSPVSREQNINVPRVRVQQVRPKLRRTGPSGRTDPVRYVPYGPGPGQTVRTGPDRPTTDGPTHLKLANRYPDPIDYLLL